jgi:hypothetical protein
MSSPIMARPQYAEAQGWRMNWTPWMPAPARVTIQHIPFAEAVKEIKVEPTRVIFVYD